MKRFRILPCLILALILLLSACDLTDASPKTEEQIFPSETFTADQNDSSEVSTAENLSTFENKTSSFDLSQIPSYTGNPFFIVNENTPFFTEGELSDTSFESYSSLDAMGRCGAATACVGKDLMPTEDRGSIGQVKPSGWQTVKYDIVDGKYLYNRCHLIGFQLTGENANPKNLITGTRYLNVDGMLPFENMVADFIKETGYHVMYRVTPIFSGSDLLAKGVLMEGVSVEDEGEGISFCVFCYNVQPGIDIQYATGESALSSTPITTTSATAENEPNLSFVLNTNSKKIHFPDCPSAAKISSGNRKEVSSSLAQLLEEGYSTCGNCFS